MAATRTSADAVEVLSADISAVIMPSADILAGEMCVCVAGRVRPRDVAFAHPLRPATSACAPLRPAIISIHHHIPPDLPAYIYHFFITNLTN
jgi:hypothetical protein